MVPPRKTLTVLSDEENRKVKLLAADVICAARAPLPKLVIPQACRNFRVVATRLLGDLYPASSQLRGEQGPVVLYFTLEKAKGRASHIEVMGSSCPRDSTKPLCSTSRA